MSGNNLQVKIRPSSERTRHAGAQPYVTKAGEIWRTYGSDPAAQKGGKGTSSMQGSCDLGPGNSSGRDFDAGSPCSEGAKGGDASPDGQPGERGAKTANAAMRNADMGDPDKGTSKHNANEAGSNAKNRTDGNEQTATQSKAADAWSKLRFAASAYAAKHQHAVAYALIGLLAAVFIIALGIMPTLLIALLAAIGYAVGRYRDGDATMHAITRSIAARIGKKPAERTA